MENKYRIHKFKKGDNVISVAEKLGITIIELKGFHNIYCKNDEIISNDFPTHLTEIFVYSHIREIKKENYPKAKFDEYTLSFKPNPKKVNYAVMYTIKEGEDEINTLKFEVSIEFKERTQNGFFIYEINKSEIFINNEEPNYMLDELSEKISNIIYPLKIVTNQENKWIGIHNADEILKRWEKEKTNKNDYFDGDWVNQCQEMSKKVFKNQTSLTASLANDYFLNTFFSGIYTNFTPYFKFENTFNFPLLTNFDPLQYKVTQVIDEYLDEYNQVILDQEGELDDERTKADLESGQIFNIASEDSNAEKAKGTFKAKYFLNHTDNSIESVFLLCDIELDKPKSVEIVIAIKN